MKAKFINEAFERKNKEIKKEELIDQAVERW